MSETATNGSAEVAANLTAAEHGQGEALEHTATTEAHGGAAAHAEPTAFFMDATGWVSLAVAVFFGILIWKKVPALIGAGLDKKIAEIRQNLDEAKKLRAEAEALRAEYEAKVKAAEAEAVTMREHAEAEAKQILVDAKEHAKDLTARRTQMAEDKIAAAERAAIAEVRAKAVEAAANAAAALIAEGHSATQDKALVDQTIAGLGTRLN
ncbi:F0F1 ATP synthase subunit B [Sphingomonas sp. LaA6.9]|uniref:F0F1 ATP synthase subunit B family protein n=1 Tax=Sphingomonas sp. LaA6.9 TaxID=2919914 RepID=UPI001F4F73D5|nr:F0F1 ATP synthase subunit B [Sphingomonas sp. LaA6.9]MCJ8155793.1 F0F1 ATP synthase subunit B [Sphingomonas sp. LaA6.9]